MTLYLIDKYDYELKKQNVETGLSIYGKKTEVCLKGLLAILIVSMCSFFVCTFAGQKIINAGNRSSVIDVNEENEVTKEKNPVNVETELDINISSNAEKDAAEEINDLRTTNESRHANSILLWWYVLSIVGMVVPSIIIFWIINRASKKLAKHIEKNLQSRFKALVNVLITMYYPAKTTEGKKSNNEYADKLDGLKVEKLIDIYESELKKIADDENRRNKVLVGFMSAIGTCIATSLAEMNNLGISINDWVLIVAVLIVIALLISVPIYFVNEINPTKDKLKSMLAILKQYLVYIVEDDKKDFFEIESETKKNALRKNSRGKKK